MTNESKEREHLTRTRRERHSEIQCFHEMLYFRTMSELVYRVLSDRSHIDIDDIDDNKYITWTTRSRQKQMRRSHTIQTG